MAPSRLHHELPADTSPCLEIVPQANSMNELLYSRLQDRTFGSAQQPRVVSKGVPYRGSTVTWVRSTMVHVPS